MKHPVSLFYLAEPKFGGWVSFTAHLALSLAACGYDARIYRVGVRTESRGRDFGRGLSYANVSLADAVALASSGPTVITAVGPKFAATASKLLAVGAGVVVHDPTELKSKPLCEALAASRRVVVIRERVIDHVRRVIGEDPRLVLHPYVRMSDDVPRERPVHAVAFSRLDWDKHTLTIAEANAKLLLPRRVAIYGAENSMYTHLKIDSAVPGWREQYHGRFAPTLDAAVRLAEGAQYVVDLSAIAGDGDGTQYTFLEAWDAGATLIVNAKWIVTGKGAVRAETAIAVTDAEDLARVLNARTRPNMDAVCRAQLAQHAPAKVVPQFVEAFGWPPS